MAKPAGKGRENKEKKQGSSYGAKDIFVLEGLEPVKKRPGMYIGSTGPDGLHHLVAEVFDNAGDEALGGHAKNILVELLPDNMVAVTDDGRGIPVETHAQTKKSALETVMTTLHAGGKFGGEGYKISGGLHGVGVSVVNALSIYLRVEVRRDGGIYMQEYERGVPKAKVKKIGAADATGTKVIFSPDPAVFPAIEFNDKRIIDRLRQHAYLIKGVRVTFADRRGSVPKFHGFCFEGGVRSFVKHLAAGEKSLQEEIFHVNRTETNIEIEIAFLYTATIETKELSFANNIHTPDGGMHLTGFRSALTRSVNNYARQEGYLKEKDENLASEDTREGLVAIVSVRLREPQFEGQTKNRLGNPEVRTATETVSNDALKEFLEKHPQEARRMIEKVMLAAKARMAAKAAKDTILRKGALEGLTLPGKLADCSSRSAEESELFIVEGDSAGGCFSGDTKIALLDGRALSFKELIAEAEGGKQNYCYTVGRDGNVAIAPILYPRRTKKSADVIMVVLDNGEAVTCTPDHKFMLRDGSYCEAKNLHTGDSLMPLCRKYSKIGGKITIDGYEMVFQPRGNHWVFTHLLSDEHNLQNQVYAVLPNAHRHHKDFNKLNNNPENIIRLTKEDHLDTHRTHADKTLRRPDVVEKVKQFHQTPEYREKVRNAMLQPAIRSVLSARAKKQWERAGYKEFMKARYLNFYYSNDTYRAASLARLHKAQREYWSDPSHVDMRSEHVKNYFVSHPEKREEFSRVSKKQWENPELRELRSELTKEQWTPEFRAKRKEVYNQTYLRKALDILRTQYEKTGTINQDAYDAVRRARGDRSLIRLDTIVRRFFSNDVTRLQDAVVHHNHKVKEVIHLNEHIDVYDIEVPETHNFALASGVFVHNSAKSGRDRRTQAILPLRGKVLNVERARLDKMLANLEIRSLVIALGTAIAESFDIAKLRYHKIILMSDADVDGAHIRTLLLTLFYRYFRPVIEGGYLYIATPPLYRVQSGKDVRYAYDDTEKEKVIKELLAAKAARKGKKGEVEKSAAASGSETTAEGEEADTDEAAAGASEGGEKIAGVSIARYKGLGEMNPEQLWETTMNPERRILKQVTIEDAEEADRLFDILMGDQVEPRKQFIQVHAATVQNLDV